MDKRPRSGSYVRLAAGNPIITAVATGVALEWTIRGSGAA